MSQITVQRKPPSSYEKAISDAKAERVLLKYPEVKDLARVGEKKKPIIR